MECERNPAKTKGGRSLGTGDGGGVIGHLCLLIGLIQRRSKLSPIFMQKVVSQCGLCCSQKLGCCLSIEMGK